MKKIVSLILMMTLLVGCVGIFSGCGSEDDGAQIVIALGDVVYDFDPSDYYVDDNEAQLLSLMYEPLFRLNARGRIEKAAAKSYKINKKERTITVVLRESYWSDGKQVTAQDFIYAWRDRIIDPARANPAAALFYDVENAMDIKTGKNPDLYSFGAVATEYNKITIRYREGADVDQLLKNLSSVAASPVREDVVRTSSDHWIKSTDTIVSNGPFYLSTYLVENTTAGRKEVATAQLRLARNTGYRQSPASTRVDRQVTPAEMAVFWVGDHTVELTYQLLEANAVFFIGNNADADTRTSYQKKAKTADLLSTYSYLFNTENPLFADARVRRALSLALDRETMASAVTFATAAGGFYPGREGLLSASSDLSAAQALLDEVDFTGLKKEFTLTVNDDEDSRALAGLAQVAWEELGFKVSVSYVQNIQSTVFDTTVGEDIDILDSTVQATVKDAAYGVKKFDVIGIDFQMYSTDKFVALCALTSTMNGGGVSMSEGEDGKIVKTNRTSVTGWTNAEYDSLVLEAHNTTGDKKARLALLNRAEELLVNEAPLIPVLYNQSYGFVNKKLKNVSTDGYGFFVFTKTKLKNYQDYFFDKMLTDGSEE